MEELKLIFDQILDLQANPKSSSNAKEEVEELIAKATMLIMWSWL